VFLGAALTVSQITSADLDSLSTEADLDSLWTEAAAWASASAAVAFSCGAATTFVISNAGEDSTDAVTVSVCEFVAAGSDCASATTKDGSVHTDLMLELSKSSVITNTAITAAKRYRINFHPWCGEGPPDRSRMWTFRG
jgi:hypothetical protein